MWNKNIWRNNGHNLPKFGIKNKVTDPRNSATPRRINTKRKSHASTSQSSCWTPKVNRKSYNSEGGKILHKGSYQSKWWVTPHQGILEDNRQLSNIFKMLDRI